LLIQLIDLIFSSIYEPVKRQHWILFIIVIAQFCATSLWFVSNSVITELIGNFELSVNALGYLTSAVQFGFISGTLVFAILALADRYNPSKIFFLSAFAGALFNWGIVIDGHTLLSLISLRFFTGFFLAGVYPVGMKIVADYYKEGLGGSLGFLVGALVLGTAFPHLLKSITTLMPWQSVIIITSIIATLGGILMVFLVPVGPYRKKNLELDLTAFFKVFKNRPFRAAAFGYFGHMWELYAFWAFVPILLSGYLKYHPEVDFDIPLWSFLIIGLGSLGCIISGYLSTRFGPKRVAFISLLLSGSCCLVSPLLFYIDSSIAFRGFLVFWGLVVIADSPLFSTLVAENTKPETKGTALTIVNCIGFLITIVSIQLLVTLQASMEQRYLYVILALGPLLGLLLLGKENNRNKTNP